MKLSVADEPSREVPSPPNYAFQVGIKPQPEAQSFEVGVGDMLIYPKAWGQKRGR